MQNSDNMKRVAELMESDGPLETPKRDPHPDDDEIPDKTERKRIKLDRIIVPLDLRKPPLMNPLMLDVVLSNLFEFFSMEDLKSARLVNKKWNTVSNLFVQKRAHCCFTIPKEFEFNEWSTNFDTKSKHDQFVHYTRCQAAKKLPLANSPSFLFRNFDFINFKYFGPYLHDRTLNFLQRFVPNDVQGLRFEDDSSLRVSNEFLQISNIPWAERDRQFQYPDWNTVFSKFSNLQCLELVNMPRGETEKCLTALETLLENGIQVRMRKLVVSPMDQAEFHMNAFAYLSYVDLLKNVVSLLPLKELHLASKCSGGEVRAIVESRREELEVLVLKRFVRTEEAIHALQEKDGTLFQGQQFPKLRRLHIPSVYIGSFKQIMASCPEIRHLKLNFQPVEICVLVTNSEGVQVLQSTRILKNSFFTDTDTNFGKDSKLESIHWTLDEQLCRSIANGRRQLQLHTFNFYCTCYLTTCFPNIKSYTGIILSERELRVVFQNLKDIEELRITSDSLYCTKDIDLVGVQKNEAVRRLPSASAAGRRSMADDREGQLWGIRLLSNLRRLYLENDNNNLSYDAFGYGFLKLPKLQILHIHRAQRLSEDNTAIVALLDSSSLSDVQILDH